MNILFFLHPKAELAFIYDYHTVRQAMEIMEHYKYSCVPILNKEGKYVGTITEGDLLWGLKDSNTLNIRQAENLSVMKFERRHDYLPVSIEADMDKAPDGLPASTSRRKYRRFNRPGHGAEFCTGRGRSAFLYRYCDKT